MDSPRPLILPLAAETAGQEQLAGGKAAKGSEVNNIDTISAAVLFPTYARLHAYGEGSTNLGGGATVAPCLGHAQ